MTWNQFIGYLGTALMLGAIIGAERQWHQRIAGLRTNALVSGGAAMFVSISHLVPLTTTSLQVAAQVVSGIGFLGAGVIMREGVSIRGLNTAATLWCSAAVGALCGFGFVAEAVIGAFGVVGANLVLRPLARKIGQEKANQAMLTVQKESEAERQKRIAVIQKQAAAEQTKIERNMQADVEAYATIKTAEAEKLAAQDEAAAKLRLATADKEAKTLQAEGDQAVAMIPVNVAGEQVKLDQSRVEVLKLELETKSANQRLSFELELQKAKIAAERDVRIALANAMGQALSSSEFKIYGDPATAAKMLAMFTSGQEYAQVIDGFVRQAPSEVTDLAMNSIGQFSEAAAGLVKKLFDQEVPPNVIAEAVANHLKEVATPTNSNAAAAAGAGAKSAKTAN